MMITVELETNELLLIMQAIQSGQFPKDKEWLAYTLATKLRTIYNDHLRSGKG